MDKSPFSTAHNQAVRYLEFEQFGWSKDDYLRYCELCSNLRASAILVSSATAPAIKKQLETVLEENIIELLQWIKIITGAIITPDYDIAYVLIKHVRYLDHTYFENIGIVPNLYRSDEDFRQLIESNLYRIINNKGETQVAPVLYCCNTKQMALRMQQDLLQKRKSIYKTLQTDFLPDAPDVDIFQWAIDKACTLKELEAIDDQLDCLQWRIDEFENGGEFEVSKHILYVYKGYIMCEREKHPIICVNAHLHGVNNNDIDLPPIYGSEEMLGNESF